MQKTTDVELNYLTRTPSPTGNNYDFTPDEIAVIRMLTGKPEAIDFEDDPFTDDDIINVNAKVYDYEVWIYRITIYDS